MNVKRKSYTKTLYLWYFLTFIVLFRFLLVLINISVHADLYIINKLKRITFLSVFFCTELPIMYIVLHLRLKLIAF